MENSEDVIAFLQDIDKNGKGDLLWSDFEEKYNLKKQSVPGDRARKLWGRFSNSEYDDPEKYVMERLFRQESNSAGEPIEINLSDYNRLDDSFFKDNPGFIPRRMWEAQVKGGDIEILKSTEYNKAQENWKDQCAAVKDVIDRIMAEVENPQPIQIKEEKITGEKLCLNVYTTDDHIGLAIERSIYGESYGIESYTKRLQEILPAIRSIVDMAGGRLDLINIVKLGDTVDGLDNTTRRGGHALTQNLNNHEQAQVCILSTKHLIDQIVSLDVANNIGLIAATNCNHGGIFNHLCFTAVKEYLNVRYPDISTDVNPNFIFHKEYGVHRFIFCHGKDEKYAKRPLPFQLNKDTIKIINDYIEFYGLDKHIGFKQQRACIHFLKGDLHTSGEEYGPKFRYKNFMALAPGSDYIEHNYGLGYSGFEFELFFKDRPFMMSGKNFYFK